MMGQSGGRSRRHPEGEGARRRATPRERQGIDPPWDNVVPRYRLTVRGQRLEAAFNYFLCFALGAAGGILVAQWFGVG